jgi:two-component system, OmpR family, phosphate regulon sensor histidine kinase PhoR
MKTNTASTIVRLVSIAGIICLLALQFAWLQSAYSTVEQEVLEKSRKCLQVALDKELGERMFKCKHKINIRIEDKINEKENILIKSKKSDSNTELDFALELIMDINNIPCELNRITIIFQDEIKNKIGYIPKMKIELIKDKLKPSDSVYHSTRDSILIGKKTDLILLSNSFTSYVKVTFLSPHKMVFQKARYILIISLILVVFIGIILVYQLVEFYKQRKFISFIKDYTRIIAHDLRSPISNIKMISSLLTKEDMDNNALQSKVKHETINQCNRLLLAVDNILLVAQTERKDFQLEKSNIFLNDFIGQVLGKYQKNDSFQKPILFNFKTEPLDLKAYFDTRLMENVFDNLIENAIKYSDISVEITIAGQQINNNIVISIKDNGFGISEIDQKQIFQLFERGDYISNQKYPGFGIGLHFVQKVVKAHHGKIQVNSKLGIGSEFVIQIPNCC